MLSELLLEDVRERSHGIYVYNEDQLTLLPLIFSTQNSKAFILFLNMVAIRALASLFLTLISALTASPIEHTNQPLKRCTATISSYSDVATAVASKCSTVGKHQLFPTYKIR